MNAKKCDRCGEFYEMYIQDEKIPQNYHLTIWDDLVDIGDDLNCEDYDICPECTTALQKWLEKRR